MKSEFKAKFLSHLLKRKDNEGFTLIELLVVIIIIGILSAIALPSFLNQAAKAKQSEAKNYVGAVQRAQQAYRIENAAFAQDINSLQIGLPAETENYSYTGIDASTADETYYIATPKDTTALKGFSSGVAVYSSGQTAAISCQTKQAQAETAIAPPNLQSGTTVASSTEAANCTDADGNMENMK